MEVLLVHRYFWPDTPPYAHMLKAIAQTLVASGHQVTVLTAQPSYNRSVVAQAPHREVIDGVTVMRSPVLDDRRSTIAKIINLIWFSAILVRHTRRFRRADVVVAATTPPVVVALVCSLLSRSGRARFIYHKQDIWPEVSVPQAGGPSPRFARLMRRIDRGTERRARRVVVLSEDMADTVARRGGAPPSRIVVINNFDPWETEGRVAHAPRTEKRELDLLYAGNLGRFQALVHVAELIESLRDEPRIRWHFFGDGPMRPLLAELVADGLPVALYGHRPPEDVAGFIRDCADLGIVSLSPGVIRAAYPSKTMTYLRHGCPLLALVEQDTELASMIRRESLGVTAGHGQVADLANRVRALVDDRRLLHGAPGRARRAYVERFEKHGQLERWTRLVEEVAAC